MESKLRVGVVGYTDMLDLYIRAFEKIDSACLIGTFWNAEEVDAEYDLPLYDSFTDLLDGCDAVIFLGEKVRKKLLNDAIRALKHVFIDDYSAVLNGDIDAYCSLAAEAQVVVQVSMPKMYYWNVFDVKQSFKHILYLQFIKEQSYTTSRFQTDVVPELTAALKIMDSDVMRAHTYAIPLLSKKVEQVDIRLDFANGSVASITNNPCGLIDRQELRIISDKELATLDLRRREWHSLVRNAAKELQKELINMEEVPFVELTELQNFFASIESKEVPMVSLRDIKNVHRTMQLMDASN